MRTTVILRDTGATTGSHNADKRASCTNWPPDIIVRPFWPIAVGHVD